MGITDKQRERRRYHLGSSDIPALLGYYGSAYDVWASKVYELEPAVNDAMKAGTLLEDAIISWAETDGGLGKITRNQYRRVEGLPIGSNIDGIVDDSGAPVEGKSVRIVSDWTSVDEWGEPGTGEVPQPTIAQCHSHMMATKKDICWVPTLIGGRGFALYRVERQPDLVDAISVIADTFWEQYVKTETPPDDDWSHNCQATLEILKRIVRVPQKVIKFDKRQAKLVDAWQKWQQTSTIIENQKKIALASVLAELDDAEAATLPDGQQFMYMLQASGKLRDKDIKAAHPEIAEQFKAPDYRVPRVKKGT